MKHVRLPRQGGKTSILLAAVSDFLEDTGHQCWAFIVVPNHSQVKYLMRLVERRFGSPRSRRVKVYDVASFRNQSLGFANVGIFIDNIDMIRDDEGLVNILRHPVFTVMLATETGPERFWADDEDVPVNYDLVCIWCGEELESAEALEIHEESHE